MPAQKRRPKRKKSGKASGKSGKKAKRGGAGRKDKAKTPGSTPDKADEKHGTSKAKPHAWTPHSVEIEETSIKADRLESPESTAIVTLKGFLQRREANEIMRTVSSLQSEGVVKVIFDLTDVHYANSSAIGTFVNCASTLKARGGQVVLLAMRPNILKVFETLGLAGLFHIVSTRSEAIEAVS